MDRPSFDRLLLEHVPAALRFAIRLCGEPDAAEDVLQDAIVRAVGAYRSLRDPSRVRPWFFRIVVNVFRDRWRTSSRANAVRDEAIGEAADHGSQPIDLIVDAEIGQIVALHVSNLPPRQREVLVLIAYEQMSPSDVAMTLEMTEQNVRTTLHLARQKLREQLARYER